MNRYPRHVGDITLDTFGLSCTEFGCYNRMLDWYYANEKPLPPNIEEVYRAAGCRDEDDAAACDYVLKKYFTLTRDGYRQKRADAEIEFHNQRVELARKNGMTGGRPKNPRKTDPVISGNRPGSQNALKTTNRERPIERNKQEPRVAGALNEVDIQHQRVEPAGKNGITESVISGNRPANPNVTQTKASLKPLAFSTTTTKGGKPVDNPAAKVAALPDWLPAEDWNRWVKNKGSKLTPQAKVLQIKKLDTLRQQGHAVSMLIDMAIEGGWATFYPPKEQKNGGGAATGWWSSEQGTINKGRELAMAPRPGETMNEFRGRINAKLSEKKAH